MARSQIERIGRILDDVEVPCLILDVEHYRVVYANPATGLESSSPEASCHEVLHGYDRPCDRLGLVCPIGEIRDSGGLVSIEHVHEGEDGRKHLREVLAHPLFDDDGRLSHILEVEIDVRDRRHLAAAKRLASVSLDSHAVALVLLDPHDRVALSNLRDRRGWSQLTAGSLAPSQLGDLDLASLKTHPVGTWTSIATRASGSKLEVSRIPLAHDERGDVWQLLLFRRLANVQPSPPSPTRSPSTLPNPGPSGTRDESELSAMLERSIRASRDRPPITDELLRHLDSGPEIVHSLLDYSRRSQSASQLVDLYLLVDHEARHLVRHLVRGGHSELEVHFDTPRARFTLLGDAAQLQTVLRNLTRNAREAMPGGGDLRLSLETFVVTSRADQARRGMWPGRWIRLEVRDRGQGIPDGAKGHLLRPFFTTKPKGRGLGLGLAQAYGIAKRHGGFIELDDAPGGGTTATVLLPHFQSDECPDSILEETARRPLRLLLVDDQEAILRRHEKVLCYAGHEVLAATSALEALDLLGSAEQRLDGLVACQYLGDRDEAELLEELRRRFPDLPGLLTNRDTVASGNCRGFSACLRRPFTPRELLEAIQAIRAIDLS